MNHAIILAGGLGTRMRLDIPKQFYCLDDMPIFMYSFVKIAGNQFVDDIVLVISDEWQPLAQEYVTKSGFKKSVKYVCAGKSRQHSVFNGLLALEEVASYDDVVIIHDSVRPFFSNELIENGIMDCEIFEGVLPVVPVRDAVYKCFDNELINETVSRENLFLGQSPEFFRYGPFLKAHNQFTDDEIGQIKGSAELALRSGMMIKIIDGSVQNIKLTTNDDLELFSFLVQKQNQVE